MLSWKARTTETNEQQGFKVLIQSFTKQRIYQANATIMVNGKPSQVR